MVSQSNRRVGLRILGSGGFRRRWGCSVLRWDRESAGLGQDSVNPLKREGPKTRADQQLLKLLPVWTTGWEPAPARAPLRACACTLYLLFTEYQNPPSTRPSAWSSTSHPVGGQNGGSALLGRWGSRHWHLLLQFQNRLPAWVSLATVTKVTAREHPRGHEGGECLNQSPTDRPVSCV